MLISSDEVDVSTEEDVFKVILNWIDRNKRERKKYFADLFREVRLYRVYVSRDYLHSDIVTNDLVNDNEGCMDLVKDAIKVIDSEEYRHLSVSPRKSLEFPAIVMTTGDKMVCYHPRDNTWSLFPGIAPPDIPGQAICCQGKLYFISQKRQQVLNIRFTVWQLDFCSI